MMQQTGYQVGDFAVQVGSGQNVMVAFGQQATQLVGTMAMFAKTTKMIALFSGLGILIPVISGIGAAFMRSGAEAKEATKKITKEVQTLGETISSLNNIQETTALGFQSGLNLAFGKAAGNVVRLVESINSLRFKDAMLPVQQTVETVRAGIDAVQINMQKLLREVNKTRAEKFFTGMSTVQLNLLKSSVNANIDLFNAQEDVRKSLQAISESKSSEELIKNFSGALSLFESIGGSAAKGMTKALVAAAAEAGILAEVQARAADALTLKLEESAKEAAGYEAYWTAWAVEQFKEAEEAKVEATKEAAGYEAAWIWWAVEQFKEAEKAKIDDLKIRKAEMVALVKAAAIEASGWESSYNQVGGNYDNGPDYKPPKVKTGGGSKADKLGDLKKQLKLERELLYLSEAQKRVINALGDDRGKYSAETIRGLVAEVEAIDKVNKKLEEQKSLSDKVSSSMSDAFMSIADGTTSASDAFRTMAADIIRELYKVLVVQNLVGSLTSIIGGGSGGGMFGNFTNVSANGNVFSGGSQVKAYANGGVVGRPTVFPMANGGVGLMGEAGPEAIMPLKRGSNGKLGVQAEGGSGSGGVVIHQNFNFAANGDESVKRIIAQAAPHIANMTQKQIMDSRRRGGAMKATFS